MSSCYYFKHYTNLSDSIIIKSLEKKFGTDGYAFWCKLLELLYENWDDNDEPKFTFHKSVLREKLHLRYTRVELMLNYSATIGTLKVTYSADQVYLEYPKMAKVKGSRSKIANSGRYNRVREEESKKETDVAEVVVSKTEQPPSNPDIKKELPLQKKESNLDQDSKYGVIAQIYFDKEEVSTSTLSTTKKIVDKFSKESGRSINDIMDLVFKYKQLSMFKGFRMKGMKNFLSTDNDFTFLDEQFTSDSLKSDEQREKEAKIAQYNLEENIIKKAYERKESKNKGKEIVRKSSSY